MGSLTFSSSKDRVCAEMHAEGDRYGHDGCDGDGCHWTPDSYETMYMSIEDAKKLKRSLALAIQNAQRSRTRVRCGAEGCRLPPEHKGLHKYGNDVP